MRISDWSSDVCSSDLPDLHPVGPGSPIPHGKPEGHIFSHGHVLEKRIMLKNEADVPIGDLEIRHVFAIEGHLAGIRKFKSGNDAEQGRFTCPRWPAARQEFSLVDVQIDFFHRGNSATTL